MSNSQETINALTKADLDRLELIVDKGFTGVHARQDKTNGNITAHEKRLIILEEQAKGSTRMWWTITFLVGLVGALMTYVTTNL